MWPTVTNEVFLSSWHRQTDFTGKPTLEMEGGTARFSLQQARSAYVHMSVMSCRSRCKPPGPQLQHHLVGLGQQILSLALLCHLLTMGQSRATTASHSSTSLSLLRQEASLGLAQQSLLQCRTGHCLKQHQGPPSPARTPTSVSTAIQHSPCLSDRQSRATTVQQLWGDSEPSVHPSMLQKSTW